MTKLDNSDKLVLVPYVRGYRLRRLLLLIVCSSLSLVIGFGFGFRWFQAGYAAVNAENAELRENLARFESKASELGKKLAVLERGRDIDTQMKKNISQTIQSLESTIIELKQDVSFYKSIMAPSAASKGLTVQKLAVQPGSIKGRYNYKLVLAQVANNKQYVKGVVAVNFIGRVGDQKKIFALKEISDVADLGIKFRFRYFQNIQGELMLPDGFVPEKIQIVVQSKGKKAARLEETFLWTGSGDVSHVE
ncbi:MAG: hypothetical protein CSA50_01235 [Gammaproteobacteria bacterium]|nr:MAG: hypothetical protein CSA50_01235 [Gammaproteobacteria bacterium]